MRIASTNYYETFESKDGKDILDISLNVHMEVGSLAEADQIIRYLRKFQPETACPVTETTTTQTPPKSPAAPVAADPVLATEQLVQSFVKDLAAQQAAPSVQLKTADQLQGKEPTPEAKEVLAKVAKAIDETPPWEEPLATAPTIPPPAVVSAAPERPARSVTGAKLAPDYGDPDFDPADKPVLAFEKEVMEEVKTMDDAVATWFKYGQAFKSLDDGQRRRCSNALSFRMSDLMGVTPAEAEELIKKAIRDTQNALRKNKVAETQTPSAPEKPALAAEASTSLDDKLSQLLDLLRRDAAPTLGIAVKYACQVMAVGGQVRATEVEGLLKVAIGAHHVITTAEAIEGITRASKLKLYVGAAKVKLVE